MPGPPLSWNVFVDDVATYLAELNGTLEQRIKNSGNEPPKGKASSILLAAWHADKPHVFLVDHQGEYQNCTFQPHRPYGIGSGQVAVQLLYSGFVMGCAHVGKAKQLATFDAFRLVLDKSCEVDRLHCAKPIDIWRLSGGKVSQLSFSGSRRLADPIGSKPSASNPLP